MLKNTLHLLLVGLLAGLVISGCVIKDDDDPATYMVSLTWSFTDAADCTVAQLASIDVTILEGGTELITQTIDCSAGGADIEVEDGSYTIELRATSNAGELTYYGDGAVAVAGADESLNIEMEPVGFAVFTWDFAGLSCTAAGVDRVRVMIDDELGTTNLYTATPVPDCAEGGLSTETTAFFYLDNYNLVLEGVCDFDLSTGYSYDAIMMVTEKGENNYGLLHLDAVGGGCP